MENGKSNTAGAGHAVFMTGLLTGLLGLMLAQAFPGIKIVQSVMGAVLTSAA